LAQIVFSIPEDLKRRFKSKLVMEGLTAKQWVIEKIKEYLEEEGGENRGLREKKKK